MQFLHHISTLKTISLSFLLIESKGQNEKGFENKTEEVAFCKLLLLMISVSAKGFAEGVLTPVLYRLCGTL